MKPLGQDSPLVRTVREMMTEQTAAPVVSVGGKVANYLDYSHSRTDPDIHIFGGGTMRLSQVRKMVKEDLIKIAGMVDQGKARDILASLSDPEGRGGVGILVGRRLHALAEVEEFIASPDGKRKVASAQRKAGR